MIDAVMEGTLMNKTEDEAYLIEEMPLNNYQWSNEKNPSKKSRGKFDVDSLTLLTAKMDAMTQRLECLNFNVVNAYAPSLPCDCCRSFDHVTLSCQVGSLFAKSFSDQVADVRNFQPRLNHDPYSNTYNPGYKNPPNLFYMSDPFPFA